jgi:hypothetical protein
VDTGVSAEHVNSILIVELSKVMNWVDFIQAEHKEDGYYNWISSSSCTIEHENGSSMFLQTVCRQNYSVPLRRSQSEQSPL